MPSTPLDLLALTLATWRLAYLVTNEPGPFRLFARVRERTTLGGLLSCIYCFSIYAAAICLALYLTPLEPIVWVLALSGGALILRAYTGAGLHDTS